jgi:NADH-quinone oxidoreductase subunit N
MSRNMLALLPQLVVGGTIVALMLADALLADAGKRALPRIGVLGILAALVADLAASPAPSGSAALMFNGAISVDPFTLFFQAILLGVALLALLVSPAYLARRDAQRGEFYVLLAAALLGMMVLVAATNLVTIFLGVELLSIALYVLSAFMRREEPSQEAGLKYLLIGGFASGFLLYGMALVYGGTGTTSVTRIAAVLPHLVGDGLVFAVIGIGLMAVGLAFKVSAAPFHAWTPDVYQGSPSPVVAFMSVGTKVAAIAAFLRVFAAQFGSASARWSLLVGAVAALSMIVGAVGALRQAEMKRMLAYSSVAQAGYLLLAVVAANQRGMVGGLFYLGAYAAMTFGAFGVVTLITRGENDGVAIESLRGLAHRSPVLGALLALFMLSLGGFPPTVGFMAKLFVFTAAISAGYAGLTVVAIIASAISIYYYLRVVAVIYSRGEGTEAQATPDASGMFAVSLAGALTLLLGIFPGVLYNMAQRSSLL